MAYLTPVWITVELTWDTGEGFSGATWEFSGLVGEDANRLYDALKVSRLCASSGEARRQSNVSLVYWDQHPSHKDASGMIIKQHAFAEER